MREQNKLRTGALTVDVEDGVNIGMRDLLDVDIPPTDRVLKNTRTILELFGKHNVQGTFFTLGQVAEHYPQLVKEIDAAGHEIGVHGYDHFQFFRMDYATAYDQLDRARKLLQDLTGQPVVGHRAPAFSIYEQTKWGLELLSELGFEYDSSIMPCKWFNYGWSSFNKEITKVTFGDTKALYELPMSVDSFWGRELPCLGGSYLRLLPISYTKRSFRNVAEQQVPIVFIHPYELDEVQYPEYFFEALKDKSWKIKARLLFMRLNRKQVSGKLSSLFEEFNFGTMQEVLNQALRNPQNMAVWSIETSKRESKHVNS